MKKSAATLLLITLATIFFCWSPRVEAAKKILPASKETSIFLTPLIGGYSFSSEDHLDPAFLYGVKIGYDIVGASIFSSLGIEATYNHFSARSKQDSGNVDGDLFRIDATYPFTPRKKVVPFVAIGMGGISIRGDSYTDRSPLLNYGAGVKYFYEDYLALRMDARHLIVYNNIATRNNFEAVFGVSYYFGKEKKPKPTSQPLPDQDQDGVADTLDQCPKTPQGTYVDNSGCPFDSDKDGVSDILDDCPSTPVGDQVNQFGCTEDERKKEDERKNLAPTATAAASVESSPPVEKAVPPPEPATPVQTTAAGKSAVSMATPVIPPPALSTAAPAPAAQPSSPATAVPAGETLQPASAEPPPRTGDQAGIAQPQPLMRSPKKLPVKQKVVRKLVIEFKFNKVTISPNYLKKLREFAGLMQANPDIVATIEGHTDSSGSESYNLDLSRQRAESVKNILLGFGADADRMTTVGYGYSKPVASNATSTGRQLNRRAVTIATSTPDQ